MHNDKSALHLCCNDICTLLFSLLQYFICLYLVFVSMCMHERAIERERGAQSGGEKKEGECNLYGSADTLQHIWTQETIDLNAVCTHPYSQLKMALIKCHLSNGHVASYGPVASLHPRLAP